MNGCLRLILVVLLVCVGSCLPMSADDSALFGEQGAYVPCDEAPADLPAYDPDSLAIAGRDTGYVPPDTAAAALPASDDDGMALYGHGVGFVAKPCIECVRLGPSFDWSSMHLGSSGTSWLASRTDRTGAGSVVHQFAGTQTTISRWEAAFTGTPSHTETETRGLASINVSGVPGATHVRLNATLRNYIALTVNSYVIGNQAPVAWELVAGNWGAGSPAWDAGTVVATGVIPASTPSFDVDGLLVVPFVELPISVTWPLVGSYAQWYFRDVSPTGYRHPLVFAPPFTAGVIDHRYPLDADANPDLDTLRSFVHPPPLTTAVFEDWTLDVLACS